MLMPDRDRGTAAFPGGRAPAPCRRCAGGQDPDPARDVADPAGLACMYLCQGLSTYQIAALTGLDRAGLDELATVR